MHLTTHDAGVRIAGTPILDGVSVAVRPGAICALAGPSGSGKTTLLHVLGMLRRVDSGSVSVDGVEVTTWGDRARVRFWQRHAAFIFQDYGLIDEETIAYNVTLRRRFLPSRSRREHAAVSDVLQLVGLGGRHGELAASLSGGERQRVGIARAMHRSADVILADEPTASLDRTNRLLVTDFLRGAADRGATVVVATHDEDLIRESDAIVMLEGGRVVER